MQIDNSRREAEAELWFLVDDVCEVIKREFDVDDAFLREGLIGYAKSLKRQQQAQQQQ